MRQTAQPRVPLWGNKASKPLTEKPVRVAAARETPGLTGESVGEIHKVLECTQTHPPRNHHEKYPICLWVVGEVTESQLRDEKVALFPLRPLPHIQHQKVGTWVAPP